MVIFPLSHWTRLYFQAFIPGKAEHGIFTCGLQKCHMPQGKRIPRLR